MRTATDSSTGVFMPCAARSGKPCKLAMQDLVLLGKILPFGARLTVVHVFRSSEWRSIEVVYSFMLPRDAALRRFTVVGENFSVRSDLKPVDEARKIYEQGIEHGRLSTLAQQYGDGVVNLNIGNVRSGETLVVRLEIIAGVEPRDDGFRFRFPFALAPTYHAKARVIEVAPGQGEIELPEDEFGDVILPSWTTDKKSLHRVGFDLTVTGADIGEVSSPSHPLRVFNANLALARASLATAGDVPDRDLVLDVRFRRSAPAVFAGTDASGKTRFAALIPSTAFGAALSQPRRIAFVIDRSGSMEGEPMVQARRAVEACLGALAAQDHFSIVAFDDKPETWKSSPAPADNDGRDSAKRFLAAVNARGGTELLNALKVASAILKTQKHVSHYHWVDMIRSYFERARIVSGGGDIFLVTDGQVSGTGSIIREAKAAGIRIHCLGIGSASQDRFLSQLSGQTGGVCRFVTPRERVDLAAVGLFAAVGRPVASEVRVGVEGLEGAAIEPAPLDVVFADSPLVVFGSAQAGHDGKLTVSWAAGTERKDLALALTIEKGRMGEVIRLLQGARIITALDAEYASAEEEGGTAEKRRESRVAKALENASLEYGLASRVMALVAVVERPGDVKGQIPKTQVVPVGMPQDMAFSGYFGAQRMRGFYALSAAEPDALELHEFTDVGMGVDDLRAQAPPREMSVEDVLLQVATMIGGDGGVMGVTPEDRVMVSVVALLLFASEGHTVQRGIFMPHVQRLLEFVENEDLSALDEHQRTVIARVVEIVKTQKHVSHYHWVDMIRSYFERARIVSGDVWKEIEEGL